MTAALFLSSDELTDLATVDEYVAAVRDAFRQHGEGALTEPKTNLWAADSGRRLAYYGAVLPDTGAMGGLMHGTGVAGDDTWYLTPLFDAETGEPLAIIDGASTNPSKTGAAGGVGVDVLARADASTVGLIGSGAQAREQLRATAAVRDLDAVRIYSPTRAHREALAAEFDDRLAATVRPVESSRAAVDGADIVITATTAAEPVFDGDWLAPGTHVTAMGQSRPDARELDATTIARATYVPDLRARAFEDAGAFLYALDHGVIDEEHVHAELGAVVAGTAPGRRSDEEITVFDSGGTAIETVAAAHLLYENARERGRGTPIDVASASDAMAGFGGT